MERAERSNRALAPRVGAKARRREVIDDPGRQGQPHKIDGMKMEWQPIETAPRDEWVLLWWAGSNAKPKAPPTAAMGEVSSYHENSVWDGHDYRPLEWFTHWMPLPSPPGGRAMSERWVRVMADYSSTGLWERGGSNIDVGSVPISAETAWDLGAWQCQYDLLCEDYLPEEQRTTPFDAASHARWGRQIAEAIKAELPDWTVVYFDNARCRYEEGQPRSEFEYEIPPSPERRETR